jgi:hypothetical protein
VLNATKNTFLGEAFGNDANDWVGNRVVVYVDNTVMFNGNRGGVRLRMPPKTLKKSPQRRPTTDPDSDETIPF